MPDQLADWWIHTLTVRIPGRQGVAGGQTFAAPITLVGFYDDRTNLTIADGEQVMAAGTLALPASAPFLPLGTEIDLPAVFGGRTVRVMSTSVGDSGALELPDHAEYSVK